MTLETKYRGYSLKRGVDVTLSLLILLVASPLLLLSMLAVWLQDFRSPLYKATRVARGGGSFTMMKVRSMVVNAEKSGVNSTGATDHRITFVGRFIRRWKVDELSQFLNVLTGTMSIVGPRPQVRHWGVDLYTAEEMQLLLVRPGITDLASIVFSDEGDILSGAEHPDLKYNQVIRPWKSRLGLFYVQNSSLLLDLRIIWLTFLAIISRKRALKGVVAILEAHEADSLLAKVSRREGVPPVYAPPGASEIEAGSMYTMDRG